MTIYPYILATAGHVDHGKSSLIKALTGTDPDRLPEEKARGITIELGFAFLELPHPRESGSIFRLGIVDVPGHEDFVKNMVAGVGSIDCAFLVVAADDGWMPQTEEHLQILTYLGVNRGMVVLTKSDLAAPARLGEVRHQIQEKLAGSSLAGAPIVITSSQTGSGLADLKKVLAEQLLKTPPPRNMDKARLPVDRVFTMKGIGTIVTGTLTGGSVQKGQSVVIQPGGLTSKIRSVQSHKQEVDSSLPGTRTAANLSDIAVEKIKRGDVITLACLGSPSQIILAHVQKTNRLTGKSGPARPLKEGTLVRIHFGSGNAPAKIFFHRGTALEKGESGIAQLRFESPVYFFAGDRFIIRDWSEQWTLGGGVVLNPDDDGHAFKKQSVDQLGWYLQPEQPDGMIRAQLERKGALPLNKVGLQSRFSQDEIASAIERLVLQRQLLRAGTVLAGQAAWKNWTDGAAQWIDSQHQKHPEKTGIPIQELKSKLLPNLPAPELFEPIVEFLTKNGFRLSGSGLCRSQHQAILPAGLQANGNRIRAQLKAKPMEPPSKKELAPDAGSLQALKFLIETGEAIDLGQEVVLLASAYTTARDAVIRHLQEKKFATVSDLRQVLNTSRRIMVPLLEYLDKQKVTVRQGDRRVLGSK